VPGRVTPRSLEQQLLAGRVDPVYLLAGPDEDLKSRIVTQFLGSIDEDLRVFNVDRIHVADAKAEQRKQLWILLDLCRTLPMMAPRRFVVVQSAQKLIGALRDADGGSAELAAFESYLKAPQPHATLVFVTSGDLDRRVKASMLLEKHAVVVDCDPLADAAEGIAWAKAEAASEGVRIEASAARLLATLAGGDIMRLRAEFERALLFASGDGIITEAAVREIASAPTTQDPWAITGAIERRAPGEALHELALKLEAGEVPVMILGQLGWFVRQKMPPARVPAAVEALFRTDVALKTSGGEPRVLLERLVIELCG
jgi:DNA polymerase III delta subunit